MSAVFLGRGAKRRKDKCPLLIKTQKFDNVNDKWRVDVADIEGFSPRRSFRRYNNIIIVTRMQVYSMITCSRHRILIIEHTALTCA